MQVTRHSDHQIPDSLRDKLLAFRRRVWRLKMFEAWAAALSGVLVGFLSVYILDRFFDTPQLVRGAIFAAAVLSCALIPIGLERWVWRRRRLDQLARLLSKTHRAAGDQLLGVIELSEDASEQSRSPELVEAAIRQVAAHIEAQDLSDAIPNPQHIQRGWAAGLLAAVALLLLLATASAANNAWARFLKPWADTPRYTFAAVEPLPERMVVPHGERFELAIELQESTDWKPSTARVSLPGRLPQTASLDDRQYEFELPSQISPNRLDVRVGDFQGQMAIEPMLRPELSSLRAEVVLPGYLGRDEPLRQDVRGATVSVVKGSQATLTATASRPLASAAINGEPRVTAGDGFSTEPITVDQRAIVEMQWRDEHGLTGQAPFELTIEAVDDEPPLLVCENLPRRKTLLDSEVLTFQVRAHDDFGVKRVGIEWVGVDETIADSAEGETIIGAGDVAAESLALAATFCAAQQQISPQPIAVRVFVEDYLPGRQRIYSPTCLFNVLDPEQHSIWMMSQLSRWHQMSLDVRDRELQLHETNKRLRGLDPDQLSQPETHRQLVQQAGRERDNGRRLANLVQSGEGLLKEAMRNPEIGVGHLDKWAEMMQVLKDIAANRMPSVADLLEQAAQGQPQLAQPSPQNQAPAVGENRLTQTAGGQPKQQPDQTEPTPPAPTISDIESTHNEIKPGQPKDPSNSQPKQPRLTLPTTMLAGNPASDAAPPPADGMVDDAVREQKDLLAEFEKIADELNEILANLEGSTLVKRLKASSRKQQQVAGRLASLVGNSFGVSDLEKESNTDAFRELAETEAVSSQEVSHIMDDMDAYFERSRYMLFGRVLEQMRQQDVTASLRTLGDELRSENGLSISQAEYWSDTLDRWAEDLVEVAESGACPGSKAKGSLPPSIVLEVLKLLEGEVKLREQTRVAEQARPAVSATEHMIAASQLSETQDAYQRRMDQVIARILQLPDAEADFANETSLLGQASAVMAEATEVLAKPETGSPAIAVETEVIELLLQSKRFNPNAGGGGGASPGGGGSGDTETPALALVGSGVNEQEVREELSATQATGTSGPELPEEFRSGLDEYFNRLEAGQVN